MAFLSFLNPDSTLFDDFGKEKAGIILFFNNLSAAFVLFFLSGGQKAPAGEGFFLLRLPAGALYSVKDFLCIPSASFLHIS